jgi:hypothetical protein
VVEVYDMGRLGRGPGGSRAGASGAGGEDITDSESDGGDDGGDAAGRNFLQQRRRAAAAASASGEDGGAVRTKYGVTVEVGAVDMGKYADFDRSNTLPPPIN